jgi:hypothetical protein
MQLRCTTLREVVSSRVKIALYRWRRASISFLACQFSSVLGRASAEQGESSLPPSLQALHYASGAYGTVWHRPRGGSKHFFRLNLGAWPIGVNGAVVITFSICAPAGLAGHSEANCEVWEPQGGAHQNYGGFRRPCWKHLPLQRCV